MRSADSPIQDSWADSALNTKDPDMLMLTQWTTRPLSQDQQQRLLTIWGTIAAEMEADPAITRICHFQLADGSGGLSVHDTAPADAALYARFVALHEFLDIRVSPIITLDEAMAGLAIRAERYPA
jgi:hypothetical protein